MPRGDATGPAGLGPMTGRAAGYCAGYNMPGYANPIGGRGFGMGYGRGFGFGRGSRGGGFGWRHRFLLPVFRDGRGSAVMQRPILIRKRKSRR